jgi:formylglycine-generating enzyme required for sulfatase activity
MLLYSAQFALSALPRFGATLALAVGMLVPPTASAVTIDWVTVGAPGNAADTSPVNCGPLSSSPCGAVASPYRIGKYEVTNAQYAEFLNKVAATDTNALYNTNMGSDGSFGGIDRSGISGSYFYAAKSGFASEPVAYVSFWDAARFSNWLQNGQPTGLQTTLTTEDGAYTLTPAAIAANSVLRKPTASVFLANENEWYKAAYYDPIAGLYYDYPTGTNAITGCRAPGSDTGNSANCGRITYPPGSLTDVGAYALSDSPSGSFDQGGNVWEWHEQIKFGSSRGLRGGAWIDAPTYLAADFSNSGSASAEFGNFGFRVASIPEPSTGLLVMVGLLGLAARNWRCAEAQSRPS